MNDPASDPNWGLLPHDPVGFFDLPSNFDRVALRRAYNAHIRRFKPERHPEEFQRIRAAFEELETALRFGFARGFDADAVDDENEDEDILAAAWPASDLAGRLAGASPDELYRELEACGDKTPQEHYTLAVLSDVVAPDRPAGFAVHLAEGLRRHPDAHALRALLAGYFHEPLDEAEGAAAIRAAAALDPGDVFGFTEPLWIRLGGLMAFPEWSARLAEAEEATRSEAIGSRAFHWLRITRAMVFRADREWLISRMRWVGDHEHDLPAFCHDDLDRLEMLVSYRWYRDDLLAGHPFRARVDRALRASVENDDREAAHRDFLELQHEILASPKRTLEAFPTGEADLAALTMPYLTYAGEVAESVGIDREALFEDELAPEMVDESLRFLDDLEDRTKLSSVGRLWNTRMSNYMFGLGILCLALAGGLILGMFEFGRIWDPAITTMVVVATTLAVVVVLVVWGLLKAYARRRRRVTEAMRLRAHREIWRDEVVRFQRRAQLTHWQLIHATHQGNASRWPFVSELRPMLATDHGLVLYAIALRFQG